MNAVLVTNDGFCKELDSPLPIVNTVELNSELTPSPSLFSRQDPLAATYTRRTFTLQGRYRGVPIYSDCDYYTLDHAAAAAEFIQKVQGPYIEEITIDPVWCRKFRTSLGNVHIDSEISSMVLVGRQQNAPELLHQLITSATSQLAKEVFNKPILEQVSKLTNPVYANHQDTRDRYNLPRTGLNYPEESVAYDTLLENRLPDGSYTKEGLDAFEQFVQAERRRSK